MHEENWPHITPETKKAITDEIDKGEISIYDRSGIFTVFEDAFATFHHRTYALAVSSGTAALHSAFVAAGLGPDDEVICPAYTFFATVTPLLQTGALPVLCDASPNGNIDINKIPGLITPRTKAIVVTHMWGIPCDLDALQALCRQYNLLLIEDCSHAHGGLYKGQPLGSHGDIAAFSIQGQKIITGGEGGVLVTNSTEFFERAILFGHYNKRSKQQIRPESPYYEYATTGFGLKLRAHPFAIAMANEQFAHLAEWHAAKHANAGYLTRKLSEYSELQLPDVSQAGTEPAWYAYPITLKQDALRVNARTFCQELATLDMTEADQPGSTCPLNSLKLFQAPGLLFPFYKDKFAYKPGDFPVAEAFYDQTFKIPIDIEQSPEYTAVLDTYAELIGQLVEKYRR